MTAIQVLRQIGTVILLPVYIVVGLLISEPISQVLHVWDYYLYALSMPALGLVLTWKISPFYKTYNLVFVYCVGVFVAYSFAFPAYYPEGHPLAYMPSYKPFIITVLWGAVILGVLIVYERAKNKP